jgi:hypothetical protein
MGVETPPSTRRRTGRGRFDRFKQDQASFRHNSAARNVAAKTRRPQGASGWPGAHGDINDLVQFFFAGAAGSFKLIYKNKEDAS